MTLYFKGSQKADNVWRNRDTEHWSAKLVMSPIQAIEGAGAPVSPDTRWAAAPTQADCKWEPREPPTTQRRWCPSQGPCPDPATAYSPRTPGAFQTRSAFQLLTAQSLSCRLRPWRTLHFYPFLEAAEAVSFGQPCGEGLKEMVGKISGPDAPWCPVTSAGDQGLLRGVALGHEPVMPGIRCVLLGHNTTGHSVPLKAVDEAMGRYSHGTCLPATVRPQGAAGR